MHESEVIIELGAEGGSIALSGLRTERGWSFTMEVTDWTPELVDEERIQKKSAVVETWEAALDLLDEYPWPKLSPTSIHPDFRQKIWAAVQERLHSATGISRPELKHWRKFCGMIAWRIYERDVDIVLAEEFYANEGFASWVLSQTKLSPTDGGDAHVAEVQVSLSDERGESDLVVVFQKRDDSKAAVLIEDKIDAVFQHEQLGRYRLRGNNGISTNQWQAFEVILCAPRAYIAKSPVAAQFDATIAYEDIAAWLRANVHDRRAEFRADFLESAAPHGASAYVKKVDAQTTAFWKAAFDLAHSEFPELEMRDIQLASGNTWLELRPRDFPAAVRIFLKGGSGLADLTFNRVEVATLQDVVSKLSKPGSVHKTGKSSCIRLTFPPFAVTEGVPAVETKVRAAFQQCSNLVHFYREHRNVLDQIIGL